MNTNTDPELCTMCRQVHPNKCIGCYQGSHFRITRESFPRRIPGEWERYGIWLCVLGLIAMAILTGHH